ncbi:MAG: aminotransferase [Candidatus Sumerlaea sp.]|nr:MAG: aminotransferase [Candidatus Sumerlaea sp.]
MSGMKVAFGNLQRHVAQHRAEYDAAVARVLERGWFILGSEGEAFEQEWATAVGARYGVGVGSGTDAIHLALWAHGVGPGDVVVTVPNTCVPTAAGIEMAGARVVLCDVDETTALMDPAALARVVAEVRVRAVVPVHLYGAPAPIDEIRNVCQSVGAVLIEDAAQAHFAEYHGKRIGGTGGTVCWSFYPSKNLGAFGDAGAVTTDDPEIAEQLRMLRNYGQERRYYHKLRGTNSRLDEIQAALLRAKLCYLNEWTFRRRSIAARYRSEIRNPLVRVLGVPQNCDSSCHLFPVRVAQRDHFIQWMRSQGVECLIHYPVPIHLQEAYRHLGYRLGDFPCAERLCAEVVSLPLYPELTDNEVEWVIDCVNRYVASAPAP